MNNEINLVDAKKNFFNRLQRKNKINKSSIEDLDVESIGIVLNYQQIDLMNYSWNNNITYENYINNLLSYEEYGECKNERKRHLMILDELKKDNYMPIKIKEVFNKIYDQTINNKKITDDVLTTTMNKLTTKLSTDLQYRIFEKVNSLYRVSYPGVKDMTIENARKLYSNVNNDFTSITLDDVCSYSFYVNYNGSYNRTDLERMLKFCYDNDKQVHIKDLLCDKSIPDYLISNNQEIIKQKLLIYIDDLTKHIKNYNAIHTRVDRKNFIKSIDIISSLVTDDVPYVYRGNLKTGFLSILSFEDLLDIVSVARRNLPDLTFFYNEDNLVDKTKRSRVKEIIKAINSYEEKHNIKLIDVLGIKMHVNLDVLNEDIISMFNDLSELNIPLAVTEFDVHATVDMLENNTSLEIEILRERFISDFCNIINNLQMSKTITLNSFTVDSVNDKQNKMLAIINKKRRIDNLPLVLTVYGGYYDNNMNKKETSDVSIKFSESGGLDFFYGSIIIVSLVLIIALVSYFFVKFM